MALLFKICILYTCNWYSKFSIDFLPPPPSPIPFRTPHSPLCTAHRDSQIRKVAKNLCERATFYRAGAITCQTGPKALAGEGGGASFWVHYFKFIRFFTRNRINTPNFGPKIKVLLKFSTPPPPITHTYTLSAKYLTFSPPFLKVCVRTWQYHYVVFIYIW